VAEVLQGEIRDENAGSVSALEKADDGPRYGPSSLVT